MGSAITGVVVLLWLHLLTALLVSVVAATVIFRRQKGVFARLFRDLLLLNLALPGFGVLLVTPIWVILIHLPRRRPKPSPRFRSVSLTAEDPQTASPFVIFLKPLDALPLSEKTLITLMESLTPCRWPEAARKLRHLARHHKSSLVRMVAIQHFNREREDRLEWIARWEAVLPRLVEGRAWLYAQIGWIRYQLAELELIEAEMQQELLQQADRELRLACQMEAFQPAFWAMAASIASKLGKWPEVRDRLEWAYRLGEPPDRLIETALDHFEATGERDFLEELLAETSRFWWGRPWLAVWKREPPSSVAGDTTDRHPLSPVTMPMNSGDGPQKSSG